jgi:hypothetical protein
MPSPDQMFTLDTVQTKVTQPTTTITAQKPIDTSTEDAQLSRGIQAFGTALGSLAETTKKRRIADDISLAQEAAIRNEVMPGGLLPIAQRAFEDTQDIETANQAYADIEVFSDGEEVKTILHNSLLTPVQKNTQINTAIDNLWRTSSVSIRNPEALIQLKSKVDGLKVKNMKDVWNLDKNQRYSVGLNAISGQIDNGFDNKKYTPEEIFTGNWVQKVVGQLRTSLPWVGEDDAKLAVFSSLASNENMITNSTVMDNLMQSDFSKGVTFGALADASSTEAGKEINKIYTKYLQDVDKYYKEEDADYRKARIYMNDNAVINASDLVEKLKEEQFTNPEQWADRNNIILAQMRDIDGADFKTYTAFLGVFNKIDDATANGIGSKPYTDILDQIFKREITDGGQLLYAIEKGNVGNKAYGRLGTFLSHSTSQTKENRDTGYRQLNEMTSAFKRVIADNYKPTDKMTALLHAGMENPRVLIEQLANQQSEVYLGLTKPKFKGTEFLATMEEFAKQKLLIQEKIDERVYENLVANQGKPNNDKNAVKLDFSDIVSEWNNYAATASADISKMAQMTVARKEASKDPNQTPESVIENAERENKKLAKEKVDKEESEKEEQLIKKIKENAEPLTKDVTPQVLESADEYPDWMPPWARDFYEGAPTLAERKWKETKEYFDSPWFEGWDLVPDMFKSERNKLRIELATPGITAERREDIMWELGDPNMKKLIDQRRKERKLAKKNLSTTLKFETFNPNSKPKDTFNEGYNVEELEELKTSFTDTASGNTAKKNLTEDRSITQILQSLDKKELADVTKITNTVRSNLRKEVLETFSDISQSGTSDDDFKKNIFLLEGHSETQAFKTKDGGETAGALGINLTTARDLLKKPNLQAGNELSAIEVNFVVKEYRKIISNQLDALINESNNKLTFTANERKALELTLWNTGQYTFSKTNPTAPKARKAFVRGDKEEGFKQIYSKKFGINKSTTDGIKKFSEGIHKRRSIEYLIAKQR